jgi:DNA-binding transcriptional LysR family regulator
MDTLSALAAFIKIVELGSFAAAADKLELSRSSLTKLIAYLERKYDARLLNRTTRKLSLTDAGRALYERAIPLLVEFDELEGALQSDVQHPQGRLRVSAPFTFGILHLGPVINHYMEKYPDVYVDLELKDQVVDLVEDGFDLAIRIGQLNDSSLVARQLAVIDVVSCASPAYVQKHGAPQHPSELVSHSCLNYTYARQGNEWLFQRGDEHVRIKVSGPFRANNGDVLRMAALAGHGIIQQPSFIVGEDIRVGRLIPLLSGWNTYKPALHAVYPHRRFLSAKVKTFIEHLQQSLSDVPK